MRHRSEPGPDQPELRGVRSTRWPLLTDAGEFRVCPLRACEPERGRTVLAFGIGASRQGGCCNRGACELRNGVGSDAALRRWQCWSGHRLASALRPTAPGRSCPAADLRTGPAGNDVADGGRAGMTLIAIRTGAGETGGSAAPGCTAPADPARDDPASAPRTRRADAVPGRFRPLRRNMGHDGAGRDNSRVDS